MRAFPGVRPTRFSPLGGGLINHSYLVEGEKERVVLQRLHPVFAPEVNLDVQAVTEHLALRGVLTPRIRVANGGRPWADLAEAGIWRVLTWIRGTSFEVTDDPAQARAAGAFLARFHGALDDLRHDFVASRTGVHDTPAHLRRLEQALGTHRGHRFHGEIEALAQEIFRGAEALPQVGDIHERVVHGDPKLSNFLFEGSDGEARRHAVCLVDLDTVGRMALHIELGDAWRSWCNPLGEDVADTRFDLDIFAGAVAGYAAALPMALAAEEREAMLHGVEWITLELATRFAADALAESYFAWDEARFSSAAEHNLVRALGQWTLHRSVVETRSLRADLLRQAFDSGTLR
jgi:Ser/Thr protein kinase RdoA (MazF antagonist)